MPKKTFERWMVDVDNAISDLAGGLESADLEDYAYWDSWDAGESARDVAELVLEQAGFPT